MRVFTEDEVRDLKARYLKALGESAHLVRVGRYESAHNLAAVANSIAVVLAAVIRANRSNGDT